MKILIIGYGRTGKAAEKFFQEKSIEVVIFDDQGGEFIIKDPHKLPWNSINLALLSPGVPTWATLPPIVTLCRQKGVPIVSDMDIFYKYYHDKNFIGITGSQGKTTLHDAFYKYMIMKKEDVSMGGNNGIPVLSLEPRYNILWEVSMQQLLINQWSLFNIGVFINFFDTHQEFGDFFYRLNNKRKILTRSDILNQQFIIGDFPKGTVDLLGSSVREKDIVVYSDNFHNINHINRNNYVFVEFDGNHKIIYQYNNKKNSFVIENYGFNLISQENLGILWAFCLVKGYENIHEFIDFLKNYQLVDHRLTLIKTINNFNFFNGSKCTNGFALKTLKQYVHHKHPGKNYWILGGIINSPLENFNNKWGNDHIYIYGRDGSQIYDFLKDKHDKIFLKNTLDEIMALINNDLKQEQEVINILLTPACQSFDQFKDFEHRGHVFQDLVNNLEF